MGIPVNALTEVSIAIAIKAYLLTICFNCVFVFADFYNFNQI